MLPSYNTNVLLDIKGQRLRLGTPLLLTTLRLRLGVRMDRDPRLGCYVRQHANHSMAMASGFWIYIKLARRQSPLAVLRTLPIRGPGARGLRQTGVVGCL